MYARKFGTGFFAALAFAAASAHAQEAAQDRPQDDSIVVTGQQLAPKIARSYVGKISSSVGGQLIQFHEPVCPLVMGYGQQYNAIVERRIRHVAAEANVPLAGEQCQANLILIIASDADALVKALRKDAPRLFDGVDPDALRRAFKEGPVHVWNATQLRSRDGKTVTHVPGKEGTKYSSVLEVQSASVIGAATQQAIVGAVVVIDGDATMGKTLNQIADYAAMRALAGARPPKSDVEVDTIMTLFDPNATAPAQATILDRSYLAGLYRSRSTDRAATAMGQISNRIVSDASKPKTEN